MPSSKKFYLFSKMVQNRNMVLKIEFSPLSYCKILHFFKGLQNMPVGPF